MRLIPNWRAVLMRAWSVRLMALAALLCGIESALQFVQFIDIPEQIGGWLPFIAMLVSIGAFWSRFTWQKGISNGK